MRKNYNSLDILKYILSLFVVAVHATLFQDSLFPAVRLVVPMFFIISGFLMFRKLDPTLSNRENNRLVRKNLKRYLQLYLFWLIVLFPYVLYIKKYYTHGFWGGLWAFVKNLLFGSTFTASWYLMGCILGIAIIYALSRKLGNKALLIITIPAYLFVTLYSKHTPLVESNPVLSSIYSPVTAIIVSPHLSFLTALLYIVIGKIIAEHENNKPSLKHCLLGAVLSLIGLAAEFVWACRDDTFDKTCDCFFMLAPAAAFLVLLCLHIDFKRFNTTAFRKASTIMYCSHVPILVMIGKVIRMAGIPDQQNVIVFVLTIIACSLLSFAIMKLEKIKFLRFLKYSY